MSTTGTHHRTSPEALRQALTDKEVATQAKASKEASKAARRLPDDGF